MTTINFNLLESARHNLSMSMLRRAETMRRVYGFGYRDIESAPASYVELMLAWNYSRKTRTAFPVWSGCSDKTIYTSCGANYAMRFWHDSLHALHSLGFDTESEIKIGMIQCKVIADEFGVNSLESALMYADTIGQSKYAAQNNGNFPDNQLQFAIDSIFQKVIA